MSPTGNDSIRPHILVVEDSSVFREMQDLLLGQAGFIVSSHETPHSALDAAARRHFDLVVIDYELPEMNGQEFMHALRRILPEIAVIFVSGSLTIELAVQLSSQGVAGIFNKPANPKTLLEKITETLARQAVSDTAARIGSRSPVNGSQRPTPDSPFCNGPLAARAPGPDELAYPPRFVTGSSDIFRDFTHRLWKVRDFRSVLLLQGGAGSAFELFARELAELSIFRDGPVMVCEADRFNARRLLEVLAPCLLSHDAGTLIVPGVETFTEEQQRVLQNLITGRDVFLPFARRFRLVLAATSRLSERVDEGSFDETLFYKISSLSLTVPALSEMREDIMANARHILKQLAESGDHAGPTEFTEDAVAWLEEQDWPGNFDQLSQTLEEAVELAGGEELTMAALEGAKHRLVSAAQREKRRKVPAVLANGSDGSFGDARPPFPLASDLAAETKADEGAQAGVPEQAAPALPVNAPSIFRPASNSYSFSQRLADSLSAAGVCAAS